jgi:phytoene synthase
MSTSFADSRGAAADLAECRALLAGGSRTFHAAARLLPRKLADAATAVYAFCRIADDHVDGGSGIDRVAQLRIRLDAVYARQPAPHAADRALARVVETTALPHALPAALLEGFEWDLAGRQYETVEQLHAYALRVAGSVGLMMAWLMDEREPAMLARACELGIAMQLTNIARDVGEDARAGRLYLPRSWLRSAGADPDAWLAAPAPSRAVRGVVGRLLAHADSWYERADTGIARLPLRHRIGIRAARLMYAEIGHEVARRECDSVTARARVSRTRKALLLLKALQAAGGEGSYETSPPAVAAALLGDCAARALAAPRSPRGAVARLAWTIELFASLERRERERHAARLRAGVLGANAALVRAASETATAL